MIDGLGEDIARALRNYRAQSELLRAGEKGARQAWTYRAALRGLLAGRIVENGLVPLLDVSVLHWKLDAVALRGRRVDHVFFLRANAKQDFRHLLLFPTSVQRVLVALTAGAVPERNYDLTTIVVPSPDEVKPATAKRRLAVADVHGAWERGYRLAFGNECPVARRHRTVASTRVVNFWEQRGNGRDLGDFFAWFLTRRSARDPGGRLPRITEAIDLQALAEFDSNIKASGREYERQADEWIRKGGFAAPVGAPDGEGL